jgi:queuine tRNA-ribosyltransferase
MTEDFRPHFNILKNDEQTHARLGEMHLKHSVVETPVFMPVGTYGTVRGISAIDLETTGSEIMLCNTYHLFAKLGPERISRMGGLHRFNAWKKSILTDSGGFQVFSLAEKRKMTEEGVTFADPWSGAPIFLSPERVIETQEALGSDVMMVLDECPPATATEFEVEKAVALSTRWAKRAQECRQREDLAMFCIVQGGSYPELRERSLQELMALESAGRRWDGIAIGGMSVGEEKSKFVQTLFDFRGRLPADRPHYLMGVGTPRDLVFAVACGVDMFDCVLPSRNGRHGIAMTRQGRLNLFNEIHKESDIPLEESCECPACQRFSRAFLRHLFFIDDSLAGQLTTLHNLFYFTRLMRDIREHLRKGSFLSFAQEFLSNPAHCFLGGEKNFHDYPMHFRQAG